MPTGPKVDPFKPQQPQIPGVPASAKKVKSGNSPIASEPAATAPPRSAASSLQARSGSNWLRIGLAAGIVIVIVGVGWWVRVSSANPAKEPADVSARAADSDLARSAKALPVGPGEIATGSELERAWSSQRFIFRDAASSETIPALAVRLPGGDLWGISLREPYGTCDLEYVTNLEKLRSQYGLRATHPMVVDSCSGTVYDLSLYTNGPNGLVRGQVVRGTAIRPPVAIEIEQHGDSIVAVRMENTR